ncbi:AraC family transcriptional regulator [Actinokineospora auranticolor]|uniref:AraC-like DNA-binding protein n=1 Tax=Actinokineospora auranticolor TaxID=155976 RepID=A0A2S6GEU0_9PSEU|nr:AraC family transcriptional regulator [Actinokineospora auranticolor]PPK63720.1 AraC-like DNA-binding protein [Actinokineospora auranticolor]
MTAGVGAQGQDLLSELLRPIRLTGVFHSWWHARAPWAVEGDTERTCAVLHYVDEGVCWITADGTAPVRLRAGDLAVFPTGVAHRMSDRPERRGVPIERLLSDRAPGSSEHITLGGDGEPSRILCAGLHFDAGVASSLYRALPWVMVLEAARIAEEPLLREVIDLLLGHHGDGPGAQLITLRVFEMAFVLTLRPLLQGMLERPEVLAAARHPEIGTALLIMYTRFDEPWTVESLAREVGMSRSAFTACFRKLVGEAPAGHLTSCRMREAARLLADASVPLGVVSARVGYQSVVGFHLAFRKFFETTPGEYRQLHQG